MLACRPSPRRFPTRSLLGLFSARSASASTSTTPSSSATSAASQPADKSQDSIFTTPESPWDHVFADVELAPPAFPPSQRIRARLNDGNSAGATPPSGRGTDKSPGHGHTQSLVQRSSKIKQQRASLTARETAVFDEMFDMIFNAVSTQDGKSGSGLSPSARTPAANAPSAFSFSGQAPGIGGGGAPLNDVFRTLRRHTSRVRWTSAIDEELDRKKETMELFDTDHALLQWVMQEVFGESQRWDEEAKLAMATSGTAAGTKADKTGKVSSVMANSFTGVPTATTSSSPSYPHLITHAMRIFRTRYFTPSLSLAIFDHAARISVPSYVFGCTAPAYNELIEAKWEGWGDLEGVCNALEEMRANGIRIDGRTRIVVEKVRREVGEARPMEIKPGIEGEDGHANLESEGDFNPLARRVWGSLGETEVMRLIHRIERLALRDRSRKSSSSPREESWKNAVLQPAGDDGWSFDGWDEERGGQRRKAKLPSLFRRRNEWTLLDNSTALGH